MLEEVWLWNLHMAKHGSYTIHKDPWAALQLIARFYTVKETIPDSVMGVYAGGRNWLPKRRARLHGLYRWLSMKKYCARRALTDAGARRLLELARSIQRLDDIAKLTSGHAVQREHSARLTEKQA